MIDYILPHLLFNPLAVILPIDCDSFITIVKGSFTCPLPLDSEPAGDLG